MDKQKAIKIEFDIDHYKFSTTLFLEPEGYNSNFRNRIV